jgi:hypothetical protein
MTASKIAFAIVTASLLICSNSLAQQPPAPPPRPAPPPDSKAAPAAGAVIPAPAPHPVPPREQLEKEFQEALTGATLEGTWQMTGEGGLKGTSGLTEPKPDKYTITSATKVGGDNWIIVAKIDFGNNDANIPVPVRVVWAEDTAIITLNDLAVPMIGTYSARVMIHNGFYSGVWYCNAKNYGGVMQGRIVKTPAAAEKPVTKDQK